MLTDDDIDRIARQHGDVTTDRRLRVSYEFDIHGLRALAAALAVRQGVSRDAFEAWMRSDNTLPVNRDAHGYADFTSALMWHVWQAAQKPSAPESALGGEADATVELDLAGSVYTCSHSFVIQPSSGIRVCQHCGISEVTARHQATTRRAHPAPNHSDDVAVDEFAAMLKAKLAKARAKGRSGWRDPAWPASDINAQLHAHAAKGDPLDVAAYAMFLALRGEATSAPAPAEPSPWLGPYSDAATALDHLRRTCAEIIGADPDVWPEHRNAPLAIAAVLGLRQSEVERARAAPAEPIDCWVLIAPDGRRFCGPTKMQAVIAETRSRLSDEQIVANICAGMSNEPAEAAPLRWPHGSMGTPTPPAEPPIPAAAREAMRMAFEALWNERGVRIGCLGTVDRDSLTLPALAALHAAMGEAK
jgi:hypothetical protein